MTTVIALALFTWLSTLAVAGGVLVVIGRGIALADRLRTRP